jgi:hypothetical protein
MEIYAIRVIEPNLRLIARLNNGVEPLVEDGLTYFMFDASQRRDMPTIVPEREVLSLHKNGMLHMILGQK